METKITLYPNSDKRLQAVSGTTKGRVRQVNEDSNGFTKTTNGDLFVVCDGMGGHVGGQKASSIAVKSIVECLDAAPYNDPTQALDVALRLANDNILVYANENPELKGMGTTACIVLIRDGEAFVAHVGDSRVYLFVDKEKTLHRITEDHSLVQSMVRNDEIDDWTAEHHDQKNIILRGLGIKEDVKPEVARSSIFPAKRDLFLICSDGLSDMIDDNEIEATLRNGTLSLEGKVENLIIAANAEDKGKDNITVQLIEITQSDNRETRGYESKNPKWRQQGNDERSWRRDHVKPTPKKLNRFLPWALIAGIIAGTGIVWLLRDKPHGKPNIVKERGLVSDTLNDVIEKLPSLRSSYNAIKETSKQGTIDGTESSYKDAKSKFDEAINDSTRLRKRLDYLDEEIAKLNLHRNENIDNRPPREQ